jgi:hypothetical protein
MLRLDSKVEEFAIRGFEMKCDSFNCFPHHRDEATSWDSIAHTGVFFVLRRFRWFSSFFPAGSKRSTPPLPGWQTTLAHTPMRRAIGLK